MKFVCGQEDYPEMPMTQDDNEQYMIALAFCAKWVSNLPPTTEAQMILTDFKLSIKYRGLFQIIFSQK